MDNDEIKRLAREIAENSVDYTAYPRARIEPDAYPRSNVRPAPERASERPDELRTALIRWVNLEIDKSAEMAVIRHRVSFITAVYHILDSGCNSESDSYSDSSVMNLRHKYKSILLNIKLHYQ